VDVTRRLTHDYLLATCHSPLRVPLHPPSPPRDLQTLHIYKVIDSPLDSLRDFDFTVEYNNPYCMIGLCHFMAGDDSRMAGGESRMTGDCCRPEGSIHRCVRTHSHLYSHIYMALWLS